MFSISGERFCHLCGQRIAGQYTQYTTGLVVCQRCERAAPRCARCRIPVHAKSATRSRHGVLLCAACARVVNHCASCAEPILEVWYSFEELLPTPEPRRFCAACVRDRPRCDLCHAPTDPRSVTLTDGQYRCGLCATDLVIGEPAIRLVYTDAIEAMTDIVGAPLRRIPPLDVVSRRRMGEIRRAYAHDIGQTTGRMPALPARSRPTNQPSGAAPLGRHLLGFYVRAQGKPVIYVEAGLTRGLLLGTLAHELGHAWQSEQLGSGASALDPLVSEGFAEWVAYNALLARSFRTLASRARERQDDYGQGLSRYLEIERAHGRPAALRVARSGHF
ncbi:MAG TPA: hypothetical protein VFQ25_05780 [Ktedonobacterales bacterium]|nr:hypothetical protein [Ktedonobacterales bacterium]